MLKVLAFILLLTACGPSDNTFQGYVEGEYVYMASARAGRLEKLSVSHGDNVNAGALLFELEADSERYALRQAQERLAEAEALLKDMERGKRPQEIAMAVAQLNQAKADAQNAALQLRRDEKLRKSGGVSQKQLDNTRAEAEATAARVNELAWQVDVYKLPDREEKIRAQQAAVKAAQAQAAQALWDLQQKTLRAPKDALVFDTLYRHGEWVAAGNPVVQLLPPSNIKIRFFVPETILARLRLGETVMISMDGLKQPVSAKISFISPSAEYTPPVIYSNETRAKLVYMVEALPEASEAAALHPGQPVSVNLP